jgi:hypothetical protein
MSIRDELVEEEKRKIRNTPKITKHSEITGFSLFRYFPVISCLFS